MNLTELIKSIPELTDERDTKIIAEKLNERPLIDNPEPQGETIKPLSGIAEVFAIVQASGTPDLDMAVVGGIAQMIRDGQTIADFLGIPAIGDAESLTGLLRASGMSQAAHDNILSRLAETEPDPDYSPLIPGQSLAEQNGLGVVTKAQIIEAID